MRFEFKVPGVPVGQPRVKAFSRGGHAGVYNPTKTTTGKSNGVAEFKAALRLAASPLLGGGALLVGPLRVDVEFVFPRQAAKVWKSRPMPRYRKTTKPDRDNLDKLLMDSLTGVLWQDDNQVCAGSIDKWHAAGDEAPHVLVVVTTIPVEGGTP